MGVNHGSQTPSGPSLEGLWHILQAGSFAFAPTGPVGWLPLPGLPPALWGPRVSSRHPLTHTVKGSMPSALLSTVLSALACSQQRRHQLLASELLGKTEMYEIQCGGHPSVPERGPRLCHGGRELREAGVSQDSLLAKCILSSELTPRPRSTAPGEG